jgi:hypothetical protein
MRHRIYEFAPPAGRAAQIMYFGLSRYAVEGILQERRQLLRARSEVKFRCHVRGFARAARLATALRTHATRTPDGCEKATISLCARVVITLVSSTLRDTSFYIIYLEVPLTRIVLMISALPPSPIFLYHGLRAANCALTIF